MTKPIIFLDMDGVLCNWTKGVAQILEMDYHEFLAKWPAGTASISDVLGVKKSHYWNKIDRMGAKFWRNLEPFPWFDDLIATASEVGEIKILTSPSCHGSSADGKMQWIADRWDRFKWRNFVITNQKWLCAGPHRILIDDNDKQCQDFETRKDGSPTGGTAILFPQRWNQNHEHEYDPVGYVRWRLESL